jgi:hypothetical protein
MSACMVAIAVVSALFDQKLANGISIYGTTEGVPTKVSNGSASYVILALLCLFIAIFALSWGPIGWIYPAEIYPQMIRANAMGVTTSCSYLFNLLISLVSPIMFRDITWGTYVFFAVMCIIMAFIIYRYYPETRGRSLEEIQLIFSGALIDQRPDAHHPATAAEALLHLEQLQHKDKRDQLAGQQYPFNMPNNNNNVMEVSHPHNVSRALHSHYQPPQRQHSHTPTIHSPRPRRSTSSIHAWVESQASSIELKPHHTRASDTMAPSSSMSTTIRDEVLPSSSSF